MSLDTHITIEAKITFKVDLEKFCEANAFTVPDRSTLGLDDSSSPLDYAIEAAINTCWDCTYETINTCWDCTYETVDVDAPPGVAIYSVDITNGKANGRSYSNPLAEDFKRFLLSRRVRPAATDVGLF